MNKDTFWDDIHVDINEDRAANGLDYVNPVQVAEMFAKATAHAAVLGRAGEEVVEKLSTLYEERDQLEWGLNNIKRKILAANFAELAKSASTPVQEAFILAKARDMFLEEELLTLEDRLFALSDRIKKGEARLAKIQGRERRLERNMNLAKQYLDFEKLMQRVVEGTR